MENLRERILSVSEYSRWIIVAVLLLLVGVLVYIVVQHERNTLSIQFLDVGQGDATLITSPTGVQVLIDGGPDRKILRALSSAMPLFDRSIDTVIGTHPDLDHVGGLSDVIVRYDVGQVVYEDKETDARGAVQFRSALNSFIQGGGVVTKLRRGDTIDIGGGARLSVLFPDRFVTSDDTNLGSLVLLLQYGETSALFMGDAPTEVEDHIRVLEMNTAGVLDVDVLKLGHHGSRTSSGDAWLRATTPEVAVISRGCDNSYGHPHTEVTERLTQLSISYLDTCPDGTLTFVSDGYHMVRE
jgi:competence protein ComEC